MTSYLICLCKRYFILYTLKLDTKFASNPIRLHERMIVDILHNIVSLVETFLIGMALSSHGTPVYFRVGSGTGAGVENAC